MVACLCTDGFFGKTSITKFDKIWRSWSWICVSSKFDKLTLQRTLSDVFMICLLTTGRDLMVLMFQGDVHEQVIEVPDIQVQDLEWVQ